MLGPSNPFCLFQYLCFIVQIQEECLSVRSQNVNSSPFGFSTSTEPYSHRTHPGTTTKSSKFCTIPYQSISQLIQIQMKEKVLELIEELTPKLKEDILKELRPQYEAEYKEQLNNALQQSDQLKESLRQDLSQHIMYQLSQEFEEEKQLMLQQVSQSLSNSRCMQQLEGKLRQKIEKENVKYVEEEVRRKTHLQRLNAAKKYEEDKALMMQELSDEFASKLKVQVDVIEQAKLSLQEEYQQEKDILTQLDQELRSLTRNAQTQESMEQEIANLQQHLHQLEQTKSELKDQKQKSIEMLQSIDLNQEPQPKRNLQSPYSSAIKNQLFNEVVKYEGPELIDFDEPLALFHIERVQNLEAPLESLGKQQQYATQHTQDSQIISFNVSQPSVAKHIFATEEHNRVASQQQGTKQSTVLNSKTVRESQVHVNSQKDEKCNNTFQDSCRQSQVNSHGHSHLTQPNQSSLIERLEQLCKERLQESKVAPKQPKLAQPKPDSFEALFLADAKDTASARQIKQLRQALQQKFLDDVQQEDFYFQQISYLKLNFLHQVPKQHQQQVRQMVQELSEIWNNGHLSFNERLGLISKVINAKNQVEELARVVNEQREWYERHERLILKLQQRQSFRQQIQKENFSAVRNKRVFQTLKTISQEVQQMLEDGFLWREVEVGNILLIDQFEQQLVEREELKEEIRKKVERKFIK